MPSIVNSLVGKTGVKGGLHEFSAPGTGIRGERCVLAEFIRESIPEFSPKEKMVITGARHGMAEGGRTVAEEDGMFQAEWREYRTGLIYEAISLSQHFCSIALGVSLNGHLVSPALF